MVMKMIFRKVLLVFLLIILISACQKDIQLKEKNNNKIVLGFSQVGSESTWSKANTESIKTSAEKNGVQLKLEDAQQKQENQYIHLYSFITHKVDVIAFSPVVMYGWDSVLIEAKEAGIPVILVNGDIKTNIPSLYATYIGSDFLEEGKKAGKWVVENVDFKKDTMNIFEIKGIAGSSSTINRSDGFESIIRGYDNIRIIKYDYGNFLKSKGKEIIKNTLKTQKDIDLIFSHNDDMALGAIEAIEEFGLRPGRDIKIVSIDGSKNALKSITEEKLNCSIESNPYVGESLMKTISNIFDRNEIEKRILIDGEIFTQENAQKEFLYRPY